MLSSRQYPFNSCVASLYINTSSIVGRAAVIMDSLQVPWKKCSPDTLSLSGLTVLLTTIIRDLEANDLLTAGSLLSIMMTVFEALVAALTVRCSIQLLHVGNTWGINRHHLSTLVLKQGLSYFFLTAIFTISSVVLNFREQRGSFAQHFPNALVLPVSCILTTRFILRLKEWKDRDVIHDTLVISESQSDIPRSLPITFAERLDDFVLKEFDDSPDNSCIQSTALEM
ncbi:hypothetical protein PNOK_0418400 [Pyrrhoderma noxium]|uniref:Uncharacterized protein n=1 Tax=Pyrrhoderma noxium TaxID=2282107 RepID=A0A286UI22_9AGAM|nr:hypothetical protein PNOK_0418400 [Pyrrhoderma noxium]